MHRWGVNNEAIYATWEYLYRTVILCNGSLERIQDFDEKHPKENVADRKGASICLFTILRKLKLVLEYPYGKVLSNC